MARGFPVLLVQQTAHFRAEHPTTERPSCITFSNFPYNTIKYSIGATHKGIPKPLAGKTKLTDHSDHISQPKTYLESLAKILRQWFYQLVPEVYLFFAPIVRESAGALAKNTAHNTLGYSHGR
jgi:hypothetical protein